MNNLSLNGYFIEDNEHFRDFLIRKLQYYLNVSFKRFTHCEPLMNRIESNSMKTETIDFILTGQILANGSRGSNLIKYIKSLKEDRLYYNGLKLKHIPIIVLSGGGYNEALNFVKHHNYKDILVLEKGNMKTIQSLVKTIVKSVSEYRRNITKDLLDMGFSIRFDNGKYKLYRCYELPSGMESEYFLMSKNLSGTLTRKILIQNDLKFSNFAVNFFEKLLNNPNSKEKDFHHFFNSFPDFLIGQHDVLYSEERLEQESVDYRADIITPTRGFEMNPEKWNLIELKKHSAKLLTSKRNHSNFTKSVFNGITQLKNYRDYFNNPKNFEKIKNRFGGIIPQPNMTLLIGTTPFDRENFNYQKQMHPDIDIVTYDEILEFKKIQLSFMQSLF